MDGRIILVFLLFFVDGHILNRTLGSPLDDVCGFALDHAFCLAEFGAEPGAKDATLPKLADIALYRAEVNGTAALTKIYTLVQSDTNRRHRRVLSRCQSLYTGALKALDLGMDDLRGGRYVDLGYHARFASAAGDLCERSFKGHYHSPITMENREMRLVPNILAVISDSLEEGIGG